VGAVGAKGGMSRSWRRCVVTPLRPRRHVEILAALRCDAIEAYVGAVAAKGGMSRSWRRCVTTPLRPMWLQWGRRAACRDPGGAAL